ncbi:MAG: TerB family tellurite resistance protein [Myxococcales bacterium]|nr:TerB family tellurite resistance protein [Myxococcales bacterium]
MIWKRFLKSEDDEALSGSATRIEALVRQHMRDVDDDTIELVIAVTGMLASVAYADREYTDDERAHVREALRLMQGLGPEGVDAICATLDHHIVEIASISTQPYTRALRELADKDLRREVLDVLVDLAAADGEIAMSETTLLRRATTAMGLEQDDYVASQARYRERLSLLK